jgi:G3E family GTPase
VQLKKKIKRSINPDYLFLEPSEMIVTKELRNVTKMGLRDIQYDIGPFITLIDGPSFSFQWEERPKLLLGQMQDADRIFLSRTDMIDSKQIKHIREVLAPYGIGAQFSPSLKGISGSTKLSSCEKNNKTIPKALNNAGSSNLQLLSKNNSSSINELAQQILLMNQET